MTETLFVGRPWEVRQEKLVKALLDYYGEKYFPGRSVVELGCGYGHIGRALSRYGAKVLFSDARMEYMYHIQRKGYEVEISNLEEGWTFRRSFELILCLGVLYHLKNPEFTLRILCGNCFGDMMIETEYLDSDDAYLMMCRVGEKESSYNHAISRIGCRPSYAMIERILGECCMEYDTIETDKYNSEFHIYDDPKGKTGKIDSNHYRGIWFCRKKDS